MGSTRTRRPGVARRRARHRADVLAYLTIDAVPAAGRARRRHRRLGRARPASGPTAPAVLVAAGLPAARRRPAGRARSPAGGFVRAPHGRRVRPGRPARRDAPAVPADAARRRRPRRRHLGLRGPPRGPPRARAWGSRPTTARCRTRSAGSAAPSTWTRAATAARRRSPGCTTSASRRAGWCCCTCPVSPTSCRRPAPRSSSTGRTVGFLGTAVQHHEDGPIALAVVKRTVADDAELTVASAVAAIDPTPMALPELPRTPARPSARTSGRASGRCGPAPCGRPAPLVNRFTIASSALATASTAWHRGGHGDRRTGRAGPQGCRHAGRGRPSIGHFIREQREAAQVSVRQLAQRAGVSNPYLSQIERGLRKPSAEILQQIAHGLSISAEQLYTRAGLLETRTRRPTSPRRSSPTRRCRSATSTCSSRSTSRSGGSPPTTEQ